MRRHMNYKRGGGKLRGEERGRQEKKGHVMGGKLMTGKGRGKQGGKEYGKGKTRNGECEGVT